MIPKEAIGKAIEGGYMYSISGVKYANALEEPGEWQMIALDPSFWRCLGKALGWKCPLRHVHGYKYDCSPHLKEARHFCDLILTGGDTDAYWKELLK